MEEYGFKYCLQINVLTLSVAFHLRKNDTLLDHEIYVLKLNINNFSGSLIPSSLNQTLLIYHNFKLIFYYFSENQRLWSSL